MAFSVSSAIHKAPAGRAMTALFACLVALAAPAAAGDGWQYGRATNYGGPDDYWNIHEGSCGYGYLDKDKATGWDIAAMSDSNYDYSGSCGRCFEVKCNPTSFSDNYGEHFDRNSICRDPDASIIVQVTDTCPCYYPDNAYSNKRWCCGDMYHMDLSRWAFEKLADHKYGVMGIKVRPVDCHQQPWKSASWVEPSAENTRISRPGGWQDKRPF